MNYGFSSIFAPERSLSNDMSRDLYIARQGMDLGVLTEGDARALLKAGFLRADDLYWAEGMADWHPLGELEASPQTAATAAGKSADLWRAAKRKVTSATTTLGNEAAGLTRKLKSIAGAGGKQLSDSTRRALEDFTPQIQKLVAERMIAAPLQASRRAMQDDAFMRKLFGAVHDCLPKPVRRFVPESVFVLFCMERRDLLIRPAEEPSAPETSSGTNEARREETR